MRVPRLPLALLCAGVCTLRSAQNPPAAKPEVTQRDAPATFTSRTNLVQVPVVVRDKQGHAIGNLTKDDFFLFDKGKPQFISKFIVDQAGKPFIPTVTGSDGLAEPAAAPIAERFIAYLVDDVHLTTEDLLRVRKAALDHIVRSIDPITRIALVTTSGIGVQDFTDDLDRLREAVNRIQPNLRNSVSDTECVNIDFYMADMIQNKQDQGVYAVALADTTACLKAEFPNSTIDPKALLQTAVLSTLSIGEQETQRAIESIRSLTLRMTAIPGSRNIVMVSPGFLLPGEDMRPLEMDLLDRAIRANVTINTLDARGLYTVIPGGDASTRSINTTAPTERTNYQLESTRVQQDILEELAYGTGGTFFHNDNGLQEGLDQLTRQPDFIYLLGFSPADLKYDGLYHTLKVSLKNPAGLTLQSRRGYYAPKRPNDPEEAAREDIREEVFSRDELQDIPVDLKLQFFKSSEINAQLAVISRVDLKGLHFRRDEDRSKDTLTLVAGLFDRNGNFVKGTQRVVEMNLRDQTKETLETSGLTLRTNFDVSPGNYTIRVVVRDAEGQMMAARNGAVQIP